MINSSQWGSPQFIENWDSFISDWQLNDLNECINFYFDVEDNTAECTECGGKGWHKDALPIVNSFYLHMNEGGYVWGSPNELPIKKVMNAYYDRTQMYWHNKITDDEVAALIEANRLIGFTKDGLIPTADIINESQSKQETIMHGHDAINRIILTKARLKRLGIKEHCECCNGTGSIILSAEPIVKLVLWILHPRKGCSRGIEIYNITQQDLPSIHNWLKIARERNINRFNKLDMIWPTQSLLE